MITLKVPDEVLRKDEESKYKRIETDLLQLPMKCWRQDAIPANETVGIKLHTGDIVFIQFGVDKRIEEVEDSSQAILGWYPVL